MLTVSGVSLLVGPLSKHSRKYMNLYNPHIHTYLYIFLSIYAYIYKQKYVTIIKHNVVLSSLLPYLFGTFFRQREPGYHFIQLI